MSIWKGTGARAWSAMVVGGCMLSANLPSAAQEETFHDKLSGAALLDALKAGGHVIFIRHAVTEKDYADQVHAVLGDCSTQRALSEAGWQQARAIAKRSRRCRSPWGTCSRANIAARGRRRTWRSAGTRRARI
jgi:hypothetical protein